MRCKFELNSPYNASSHRSWQLVYVQLNNTQLNLYQVNRTSLNPTSHSKAMRLPRPAPVNPVTLSGQTPDIPVTAAMPRKLTGTVVTQPGVSKVGKLIKSYTLQYAEVGTAVDYIKRQNVLRLRAEAEQLLLQTTSQQDHIIWVNGIQMGIDLALPLDERDLPRQRLVPRRQRRNYVMDMLPPLAPPPIEPVNTRSSNSSEGHKNRLVKIVNRLRSKSSSPHTDTNPTTDDGSSNESDDGEDIDRTELSMDSIDPPTTNSQRSEQPQLELELELGPDHDEKNVLRRWAPCRPPQSEYFLLKYASGCLRQLPATASWLNKPVIRKGNKYIVKRDKFAPVPMLQV